MNLVNEGVLPPDELDDRDERLDERERARSRETVADIIREKRANADAIERDAAAKMASGEMTSDLYARELVADIRREADRLEAAWRRDEERAVEHATRHAEAVARDNCRDCVHNPRGHNFEGGNAAARDEVALRLSKEEYKGMQEALSEHDRLCEMLSESRKSVGNAAAMREALVAVKKSIDGIGESSLDCDPTILMAALTQVCARLSARIERALSAPARNCDLYATYAEAVKAYEEYAFAHIARASNKFDFPMEFDKWLFAPAEERKGEAK